MKSNGTLESQRVCSATRLLGSRFFWNLQGQGQKVGHRNKVYNTNMVEEPPDELPGIFHANSGVPEDAEPDLDKESMETMLAADDSDAHAGVLKRNSSSSSRCPMWKRELAYSRSARAKASGLWLQGVSQSSGSKGKGGRFRGKGGKSESRSSKDQLFLRMSRSHFRNCGQ